MMTKNSIEDVYEEVDEVEDIYIERRLPGTAVSDIEELIDDYLRENNFEDYI